jgi:hypothetical protein
MRSSTNRSKQFLIPPVLFAALASIAVFGCSDGRPSRVPVSGQVLIDGQPLKYGSVRFTPDNARMSGGLLDAEGRFSLSCFERNDGAVIGVHRVTIAAGETLSPTKVRWHAPKKYSDLGTSGLVQEIKDPDDSLVINLTWDGGKPFDETVAE